IQVACKEGERTVPGLVHANVCGLAVTMTNFGLFEVTHTLSGRRVGNCGYQRFGSACLHAVRLSLIADWTQDGAAVVAEITAHGDEPVPFSGCTTTAQGATRPMSKAT